MKKKNIKRTKYITRHVTLALREKEFLKKKAIGKPLDQLKPNDVKRWFRKFLWNKCVGMTLMDLNGKAYDMENQQYFWNSVYGNKQRSKLCPQ